MPPPVEVRTRTHSQQRTGSAQKCGKTRSETAITFFMTVSSAPRHALAALASAVLLICNAAVCAQAEGPRLLPGAGVPPSECTFTSRGRTELEPRFETFGTWNLTSLQFTVNKKPCWAASGIKQGAALQCLRGKHIAFVGDSTTRYQYISLLNFLHTGKWLKEWDNWFGRNPLHEVSVPTTLVSGLCGEFCRRSLTERLCVGPICSDCSKRGVLCHCVPAWGIHCGVWRGDTGEGTYACGLGGDSLCECVCVCICAAVCVCVCVNPLWASVCGPAGATVTVQVGVPVCVQTCVCLSVWCLPPPARRPRGLTGARSASSPAACSHPMSAATSSARRPLAQTGSRV